MARSLRASAAAAAKKIHAQAADHDDAIESAPTKTTRTTTTTRRTAAVKRKRDEESPEYDGEAIDGASEEEEEEGDAEDESDSNDRSYSVKEEAGLDGTKTLPSSILPATAPAAKKRKKAISNHKQYPLGRRLFSSRADYGRTAITAAVTDLVSAACCPPERLHSIDYHRPLLLDGAAGRAARQALLAWYDSVSATRGMPWRRATWLHPGDGAAAAAAAAAAACDGDITTSSSSSSNARDVLARRAYEIWISEVMAQQTRIAVVIGYWTRWMARWPTLADLAAAQPHEVMQQWSGLGYYSRAARLHEAARLVVADPVFGGLLPADVATLQQRIPGVGRYTAGAISAIVYGRPAAMVDGNVIRVLSRQLGLFADSKADKQLVDLLWAAAEALVQAVARDGEGGEEGDKEDKEDKEDDDKVEPLISDRPGRWGQALMELGSTVCAPKPDCAACPIRSTCRAYAEGLLLHERETGRGLAPKAERDDGSAAGIKDACDLCEQFPELDDEEAAALAKADKKEKKEEKNLTKAKPKSDSAAQKKRVTQSPFFDMEDAADGIINAVSDEALATIVNHARTFPLRRPKKPVREVETLVCAVRLSAAATKNNKKKNYGDSSDLFLLHQRPARGLLASLWQLPSYDLPAAATLDGKAAAAAARRNEAEAFVARWLSGGGIGGGGGSSACSNCGRDECTGAAPAASAKTARGKKGVAKGKAETAETTAVCTAQGRKGSASTNTTPATLQTTKITELRSIPWLFSHLRQTMHVYLFEVALEDGASATVSSLPTPASCCWASVTEAEATYSMGTGMRKCWDLVKGA